MPRANVEMRVFISEFLLGLRRLIAKDRNCEHNSPNREVNILKQ